MKAKFLIKEYNAQRNSYNRMHRSAQEGKSPSRYMTSRNFRKTQEKVEKMKYNPSLKRRTLHREIKK